MQGIHPNITEAGYHNDPCPKPSLSNSLIKTLLTQTPKHAWLQHPRLNPMWEPRSDDKFDKGKACHAKLTGRGAEIVVIDADDWRNKDAKEKRDNARGAGLIALLTHQNAETDLMADIAREFVSKSWLAGLFENSSFEQVVLWEENGIWCRSMIDILTNTREMIVDYKTTSTQSPEEFIRSSMVGFGYDTQDCFYRRGLGHLGHRADFVFLVQEDEPPYACYFVEPMNSMRELGDMKVKRGMDIWRKCMQSNQWPLYSETLYYAEAPAWALTKELSKEIP